MCQTYKMQDLSQNSKDMHRYVKLKVHAIFINTSKIGAWFSN